MLLYFNKYKIVLIYFLLFPICCISVTNRSYISRNNFIKSNPCPGTNIVQKKCSGYIVDHIVPLCAGGKDHASNMQWQTVEEAKSKDKLEWRQCAAIRKSRKQQ